jgi:Cgr1 family
MTKTEATIASKVSAAAEESNKTTQAVPKSRNVSGRGWKHGAQKRASSLVKTKFNNQAKTWEELQAAKCARKEALELQKELLEERRKAAIEKKERRLENEKRRAENELKNMQKSVQTLNSSKVGVTLKALSKKQLRQIKKTRLNAKTGVVEYVPAYAK